MNLTVFLVSYISLLLIKKDFVSSDRGSLGTDSRLATDKIAGSEDLTLHY